MYCENKNHLLDLYFLEGTDASLSEAREHAASCPECGSYLQSLKLTMTALDSLQDKQPSTAVFDKILADVSESIPKPVSVKSNTQVTSILQIAFGQIFIFALIYFLKIQITLMPVWKSLQNHWLVQSLGSIGISVIIVLTAGAFITLSIAPILLFESKDNKSFR